MAKNSNCIEKFLSELTDIYVYDSKDCNMPIPFGVANLVSMRFALPATPLLHISIDSDNNEVSALPQSMKAEYQSQQTASGVIYSHTVAADVEQGFDNVRNVANAYKHENCYVVLRDVNANNYLLYTLPNTFLIDEKQGKSTEHTCRISISLKSMSGYIDID